jgi:hypothetical protein
VAYKLWKKWCDKLLTGDSYIIGISWSVGPTNLHVVALKEMLPDDWLADLSAEEENQKLCYYQQAYRNQVINLQVWKYSSS